LKRGGFRPWTNQAVTQNKNVDLHMFRNCLYHISQLVRALSLVNLAGLVLLYGPLKCRAVFVAKMFRDLSPSVLNVLASKSLKLSFTSENVY